MIPVRLRIDADEGRPGSHRIEFAVEALDAAGIQTHERSTFVVR
jgi:hypothetical protein